MDRVFDDIARTLARATTRRQMLGAVGGAFATAFFAMFDTAPLSAQTNLPGCPSACIVGTGRNKSCCQKDQCACTPLGTCQPSNGGRCPPRCHICKA